MCILNHRLELYITLFNTMEPEQIGSDNGLALKR